MATIRMATYLSSDIGLSDDVFSNDDQEACSRRHPVRGVPAHLMMRPPAASLLIIQAAWCHRRKSLISIERFQSLESISPTP